MLGLGNHVTEFVVTEHQAGLESTQIGIEATSAVEVQFLVVANSGTDIVAEGLNLEIRWDRPFEDPPLITVGFVRHRPVGREVGGDHGSDCEAVDASPIRPSYAARIKGSVHRSASYQPTTKTRGNIRAGRTLKLVKLVWHLRL